MYIHAGRQWISMVSGEPSKDVISKNNTARQSATHILKVSDNHYQQAWNAVRHSSHSHTGEPEIAMVSKIEMQRHGNHLLSEEISAGIMSRLGTQWGTKATHKLESQEQVLSTSLECKKAWQPLTLWRAKDRCHQQAWSTARYCRYSLSGESRAGIISRL